MLVNIWRAKLLTTFFVCVFLKIIKIKLFNLLLSFMLACVVLPLRVYCAPSCQWEYWMCICCKRIASKSMYLCVRVYVPVCMCVYLRTYNCIYIHLYLYLHFLQREKSCTRPCVYVCVYSRKVTISCPAVVVAAVLAPSIDRGSKCQSSSAAAAAAASMSALLLFLLLLLLL